MASPFAQLLAGLTGGFQGYAKQQDESEQRQQLALQNTRLATNDRWLNEDRAAQRALREAQARTAGQKIVRGPGGQLVDVSDPANPKLIGPTPVQKPPTPESVVPVMQGGKRVYLPRSQAVGKEAPAPSDASFTTFQDYDPNDPSAPPTTRILNTRTGQPGQAVGTGKAPATKIESATNTAAKARLEAAVSEMNNAHGNMSEYEQKLATGTAHIGAGKQLLARVANAFTHDDPLSQLTQSGALAALNTTDPDLARYIRRGLSFAEGESMVSQRPSDFRTKMATFLSTAPSGASPEMIRDIQGRRTSILNPLNRTVTPSTPPAAGGVVTREQQLWDAAVAKHGKAKVMQEYGPRPGGDEE